MTINTSNNILSTSYLGIMSAIKLHDVITRFGGGNEEDISVWLRQLKLVAKLQNIDDLAIVLPLFLDGSAFAVYEQLSDSDKENVYKIEQALLTAFSVDRFQAYEEFRVRVRKVGEPVDVFLSELRRLATLAGVEGDILLKSAFIVGLPHGVSAQLRAIPKINKMSLDLVLSTARALMSELVREEKTSREEFGAAANLVRCEGVGAAVKSFRAPDRGFIRQSVKCFNCGGPHLRRWCRQRKCYQCGEMGHIARNCKLSENSQGEPYAPADSH